MFFLINNSLICFAGYKMRLKRDSPHVYFFTGSHFLIHWTLWVTVNWTRSLPILKYNPWQKNFSWSIVPLWCSTDPVYFASSECCSSWSKHRDTVRGERGPIYELMIGSSQKSLTNDLSFFDCKNVSQFSFWSFLCPELTTGFTRRCVQWLPLHFQDMHFCHSHRNDDVFAPSTNDLSMCRDTQKTSGQSVMNAPLDSWTWSLSA